jgi:hypothetical protein
MNPTTTKALAGLLAVGVVATVYFLYGCDSGSLLPLLAAILILAGKEAVELQALQNGGLK